MKFIREETVNEKGVKVCKVYTNYYGKNICGIAKCHPEDNYNSEFGLALARKRCEEKLLKAQKRRLKNDLESQYMLKDLVNIDIKILETKIAKIDDKISTTCSDINKFMCFGL